MLMWVRHGVLRQVGAYDGAELPPETPCVVETRRGLEYGKVLIPDGRSATRSEGRLLRAATTDDRAAARALQRRAQDELEALRQVVAKKAAPVTLVGAERLIEGNPLVVYYVARDHVDVPRLLRDFGAVCEGPIHLEQVGARQRARACGGAGVCGRTLCCSTFLRTLEPVTLRMAQVQGLVVDPQVTAGACGRLKCCLRYENPLYEDHQRGLPRRGWRVRARRAEGMVIGVDVLRRRVLVQTDSGPRIRLFADEILQSGPYARSQLELEPPPDEGDAPQVREEPEARGWSLLSRFWRREV